MLDKLEGKRKIENMTANDGMNNEPLITKQELADLCKVSYKTVDNWMKQGLPVFCVIGTKHPRFRYTDALEWLAKKGKIRTA